MTMTSQTLRSILSWHILLFISFFLILTHNDTIASNLANADQLYFEEIYQGLFWNHEPIHHFLFMAAPDFVHLLFYFACRLIAPMQTAFVLATLITLYLFYLLILMLSRLISKDPTVLRLYQGVGLLIISLLTIPDFWIMGSLNPSLFFADHFLNTGVMSLFSLWLLLRILFIPQKRCFCLIGLFLVVFITSLSDPTFIACFDGPILIVLTWQRRFGLALFISIAAGLGYLLLKHLSLLGIQVNYSFMVLYQGTQLKLMFLQVLRGFSFFVTDNIILFLWWLFSLAYLLKKTDNPCFRLIKTFILATVICGTLGILLFDPDVTPISPPQLLQAWFFRHGAPMIYLPPLFATPMMIHHYWPERARKTLTRFFFALIFVLQVLLFFFTPATVSLAYLFESPAKQWPWLVCVDQAKTSEHLYAGLGGYWVARPIMLLAHIPMLPIQRDFSAYHWLANIHSFDRQTFDFVVVDNWWFKPSTVIKQFGLPAKIISCPPIPYKTLNLQLFVYPQGIHFASS